MTLFASTALFRRAGQTMCLPARKEPSAPPTQARKSASRFWRNRINGDDRLTKIILVQPRAGSVFVAERTYAADGTPARNWIEYTVDHADAFKELHLAACLRELGVDPEIAPKPLPDTLEINGVIYRREI